MLLRLLSNSLAFLFNWTLQNLSNTCYLALSPWLVWWWYLLLRTDRYYLLRNFQNHVWSWFLEGLIQSTRHKETQNSKGCKDDHDWKSCIIGEGDEEVRSCYGDATKNCDHTVSNNPNLSREELSDVDVEESVLCSYDEGDHEEGDEDCNVWFDVRSIPIWIPDENQGERK